MNRIEPLDDAGQQSPRNRGQLQQHGTVFTVSNNSREQNNEMLELQEICLEFPHMTDNFAELTDLVLPEVVD